MVGCWQVIGVLRETIPLATPETAATREIGCYTCSLGVDEASEAELLALIHCHPVTEARSRSNALQWRGMRNAWDVIDSSVN